MASVVRGRGCFLVLGSFLPVMASFSKALLSLPGPEGGQHDSGSALMLREPTVPLGREPGQGSPCRGIEVLRGGDVILILVGWTSG